MKKFILILVCLVVFSACESEVPSNSDISYPPEDDYITEELTPSQELADPFIFKYSLERRWANDLKNRNISVSVDERKFLDENRYTAVLILDNGKTSLKIPFEGIYDSSGYATFGTILQVDSENAVFCGKEKVLFFNTNTLEVSDFSPDFPDLGKENLWINGASIDKKSGEYLIFATPLDTFKTDSSAVNALRFDKDGKLISQKETKIRGTVTNSDNAFMPFFFSDAVLFENYIMTGFEFYDLEKDETSELNLERNIAKSKNYSLTVEGSDFKEGSGYSYVAILYKDESPIGISVFKDEKCSDLDLMRNDLSLSVSSDEKIAVLKSDYFALNLEINFENKTHSVKFSPDDENIDKDSVINSSDGKYSICRFGEFGVGDIVSYHLSVRNNESGKHIYIGDHGGMYGGNGGYGFLKNNDVYIFSEHSLLIFDPKNGNLKFNINDNFPLGYNSDDETERGILTFRRNPDDFSFIVVYYECTGPVSWSDFGNHYEADLNYMVGFLDSNGKLIESYDTKTPIWSDNFGLHTVDMRYSDSALTFIVRNFGKLEGGFDGVFDMKTKEFKIISVIE